MKVALLASGASVKQTWLAAQQSAYDQVVAVNYGALWKGAPAVDWWVAVDVPWILYQKHIPENKPGGMVTYESTVSRMIHCPHYSSWWPERRIGANTVQFHAFADIPGAPATPPDHAHRPFKYTIEGAFCFCTAILKADSIDCYGMDMLTRSPNVAGLRNEAYRPDFWSGQWERIHRHLDHLAEAGHRPSITRILPGRRVEVR